jgi:formylglycine-generating enzyme required for sulfatase activity
MKLFRPKATFTMGASRREPGRRANEIQRQVSLNRAFYLSEKEVTNAEFSRFNSKHYSRQTNGITLSNPSQPVVNVRWQQAALFCNWLSKNEGLPLAYTIKAGKISAFEPKSTGYRLPSEAEWAYAARYRQGIMMKFPWGDNFPPKNKSGNYADLSATKVVGRIIKGYRDNFAATAPVASFSANPFGLYDLGGNVAEWINDYYAIEMNLSSKPLLDPIGPKQGEFHVIRGSSWRHGSITELRASFRDYGSDGRDDVGFRISRYVN